MKLSDPTHGLKDTELERLALQGQRLDDFRRFWDRSAVIDAPGAIADDMADDESFERSGRADAESLAPLLPPDAVVLDIGCGVGRVMKYLAPMCREVHGIDISMKMIQTGRERLGHLPQVQFHLGNGYDLSEFRDDKFHLEQARDRIRSNPVIRAGILIRNQLRRWTRPFR